MVKEIYLDNGMATKPAERAISKMMPLLVERWGNPMSPHGKGQEVFSDIRESLSSIYRLLGASHQDDFVFTSSGAEAVNHVIHSIYYDQTLESGRNHYIASNCDEAPAIMSIGRLEEHSCVGKLVQVNTKGIVTAELVAEALTPRTALVSLSWANGLTGVINPVEEISELCKDRGVALHLDATHILGKLFFNLEDINATYITFNGDLLHAPKGTGGMWIKSGRHCSSLILGGIEQAGLRAGSYTTAGLAALGEAANEALDARDFVCTEVARLRDKLEEGVIEGFPEAVVFFKEEERIPNVSAIAFPGIVNEALLFNLNRRGVYACIGGGSFQQIALVLQNSGIDRLLAQSAISFNFSRYTSENDIDDAIEIIVQEAWRLKKISEKIGL